MSEEKAPEGVSAASEKIAEVSNAVSNLTGNASETVSKVTESVKSVTENIKQFSSTNSGSVVVMLVVGALVALLTAYILYYLINRTINSRNYYLLPGTSMPVLGTQETKISGTNIPNSLNGNRSSMCFWIYIYDINKYSGSRRHVFHRGTENDTFTHASPYVYLDAYSNKLHVLFSSTATDSPTLWGSTNAAGLFDPTYTIPATTSGGSTLRTYSATDPTLPLTTPSPINANNAVVTQNINPPNTLASLAYLNAIRGITVDYVPLQRWVHIGIVVNEDLNGGSITAYVDGQLQNQVNAQTSVTIKDPNINISYSTTGVPSISSIVDNTGSLVQITNNSVATPTAANVNTASLQTVTPAFNISTVDLDHKGDIYIGGSLSTPNGAGFSGLISKIQFFNYDLNAQDVYNNYLKGPIDNLLAKMGLPPYGVRSPVYPLS